MFTISSPSRILRAFGRVPNSRLPRSPVRRVPTGNNDLIFGRNGNDTISGGAGADTMSGGLETDTFTITISTSDYGVVGNSGTTVDFIIDANWNEDVIRTGFGATGTVQTITAT
jgi:hypothetical protein